MATTISCVKSLLAPTAAQGFAKQATKKPAWRECLGQLAWSSVTFLPSLPLKSKCAVLNWSEICLAALSADPSLDLLYFGVVSKTMMPGIVSFTLLVLATMLCSLSVLGRASSACKGIVDATLAAK